jgi:DNA-binding CsgD family transcriptional regulator
MQLDEASSALIGRIYDCSLDPRLWPAVLAEIADVIRGETAHLITINPLAGTFQIAALHNWPEDMRKQVRANAHLDPVMPVGLTAPLCEPKCCTRDFDLGALHNSRYWKACFDGRGFFDYLVTSIARRVTSFGVWGSFGSVERGAFSDDDIEFARLISPHIRRSVEISGVLGHSKVEAGSLRAALDALSAAAFILEGDGRIRFRNAKAEEELRLRRILQERHEHLIGVTPEGNKLLAHLRAGDGARYGLDAHLATGGGATLHATWVTLDQAGEELGSPILLLVREIESEMRTPVGQATALYGLSLAETQVLGQLLNGHALADAAEILGVARSTVKTHLESIFRKTGANKQTDLVKLVMTLNSPLRTEQPQVPKQTS